MEADMAFLRLAPVAVCVAIITFGPGVLTSVLAAMPTFADGAAATPATDWPAAVGTLGVSTVLGWYLWYTTAIGHPKMRQDFAESAAKERQEFREELARERAAAKEVAERLGEQVGLLCTELADLAGKLQRRPCLVSEKGGDDT